MSLGKLRARVVEKKQLTDSYWWFELEFETEYMFVAGQYVSVKVNEKGDRRAYSIAGVPGGKKIGLLVDVSPGGVGSKFFLKLKVGEKVEVLGPLGRFMVKLGYTSEQIPNGSSSDEKPFDPLSRPSEEKSLIFVATGSGIAPMRAMIEDLLQKKTGSTSEKIPTKVEDISDEKPFDIRLVWGMRFEKDLFWQEEFEALEKKYKNFKFELVLSKPGEKWRGNNGHIIDVLEKIDDWKNTEVYLCGGSVMVEETEKWLLNKGVEREKIHFEKYG